MCPTFHAMGSCVCLSIPGKSPSNSNEVEVTVLLILVAWFNSLITIGTCQKVLFNKKSGAECHNYHVNSREIARLLNPYLQILTWQDTEQETLRETVLNCPGTVLIFHCTFRPSPDLRSRIFLDCFFHGWLENIILTACIHLDKWVYLNRYRRIIF